MFWKFLLSNAVLAAALTAASIAGGAQPVLIHVPNGGEPVDARTGPDGTIHLLYNLGDIPFYVKSSDGGATFTTPLPAVDEASRRPGLVFDGWSLAVGKSGAVYVAMSTNNWKMKIANVPDGLIYATLRPGAKAFTPAKSLNGRPSEGFSIAADDKGNVAATWLANKLYANFSTDGGQTFSPTAELNPAYDPCNCCTTRSVFGSNGDLAVLYREKTNDDRDMYLVIRNKTGQQVRTRISSTPWHVNGCPMTYYSISSTPNGYLAAWPTKGDIYFARLDRQGRVLAPGEIKTPGHSGMRSGVVALGRKDGASLIAWKRNGELSWQLYDAQGLAQGSTGSVPGAGKGAAGVVSKDGQFILFQ